MNSDRGWILTQEELPRDDKIVLMGYWENGATTRLFMGCYKQSLVAEDAEFSGWLVHKSSGFCPCYLPPDVWANIPQNFKGEREKK